MTQNNMGPVFEFETKHDDLETLREGFGFAVHDVGGELLLTVSVPADVSKPKLLKAWPLIREWRARVTAFNTQRWGKPTPKAWSSAPGLARWLQRESLGKDYQGSYADLADDLNRALMRELHTAFFCEQYYDPDHKETRGTPDPMGQHALQRAREVLRLFRIEQPEFVIRAAREQYAKGCDAFLVARKGPSGKALPTPRLNGPITAPVVRDTLRNFRRRK